MERGHTTYSTMPEPIMACGCTRKFLGMKYHMIPLSLGSGPRVITQVLRDSLGQALVSPGAPNNPPRCVLKLPPYVYPKLLSLATCMDHTYQSPSMSMAKQCMSITYIPGVIKVNRFLPHELHNQTTCSQSYSCNL